MEENVPLNEAAQRMGEAATLLLERITDGILLFGLNGQCQYANEHVSHILNSSLKELLGKTREQILPQSILSAEENTEQNKLDYFSSTTSCWYQVRTSTTLQGECVLFFDVTERKQLEAQLREREQQFGRLVEQLPDVVFRLDLHLRHLYISPIIERIIGQAPEAWLGKTGREMGLPAEICDHFEALCQKALIIGREQHMEFNYNGSWQRSRIIPECAVDGSASSLMGITEDITEYKRRELGTLLIADLSKVFSALSSQEEILRVAGERLAHYFSVSSLTCAYVNEAGDEFIIVYDSNEPNPTSVFKTQRLSDYANEDFLREMKAGRVIVVNDIASDPRTSASMEDFASFPVRAFLLASHISEGQVDFVIGMQHRDSYTWRRDEIELLQELITRIYPQLERVRAEQALRESRAESERQRRFFEKIFDNLSSSVFIWDRQHRYVYINRTLEQLWGIERGSAVGKTTPELGLNYPPETGKLIMGQVEQVFETGEDVISEMPYTSPTGVSGYFEYIFSPVLAADGTVEFVAGMSQDISKRKQMEQALRDSERRIQAERQRLHDLFMNAPSAIMVTRGPQHVYELTNPLALRIMGTHRPIIGNSVREVLPEAEEQGFLDLLDAVYQTGKPFIGNEVPGQFDKNGDGTLVPGYFNFVYQPSYNAAGEIDGIISYVNDVTETVLSRKRIEESEAKYRTLFESIDEGFHLADILFDEHEQPIDIFYVSANPATAKILGQDLTGKYLREIDPNFESYWYEILGRVALTGQSERHEQYAEPFKRWYDFYVFKIQDANNRRVATIFKDVTERKLMEHALRESEQRVQVERQRLQDVFMQVPALIAVLRGSDMVFELANPSYMQTIGPHRDILGKSLLEALPEMEGQGFLELLRTVYETGKPFFAEEVKAYLARKDDEPLKEVYYTVVYQPSFNASGEIDGVINVGFEVTEQVMARKRVEQSEERLQYLANSMPQLVWSASARGEIDFFNKRLSEYAEMPRNEEGIYDWQAVIHPDDREHTKHVWEHAMRTGNTFENEQRMHMRDGAYRWHLVRGIPISDANGAILRWYGTKTDIEQLKQLERQRTDFLGVVSHELKTPVTSAKAFAEVLENRFRKAGDEKTASLLEKMRVQMEKLTRLISDLLDVTKIEAGKLRFHEDFFVFDVLVDNILEEVQRTTSSHTLQREGTTGATIYGDRERIGQVLTNLLTNAIKYSPNASTVVVTISCAEQEVTLCVQDFGIGIAQDKVPHVFERFFRETGTHEDTFAGLGLGLYVACEIISRQGGKMWVESEKGQGSMFCFSLPLQGSKNTRRPDDMFVEGK